MGCYQGYMGSSGSMGFRLPCAREDLWGVGFRAHAPEAEAQTLITGACTPCS